MSDDPKNQYAMCHVTDDTFARCHLIAGHDGPHEYFRSARGPFLADGTRQFVEKVQSEQRTTDSVPEVIAIEITARTNKVGSQVTDTLEFDLEDWNAMDERDREKALLEHLFGTCMITWDWKELP